VVRAGNPVAFVSIASVALSAILLNWWNEGRSLSFRDDDTVSSVLSSSLGGGYMDDNGRDPAE
jgi:hypothetical protein